MKIRRVIRFQDDSVEEKTKQEIPKKPKKDISSNNEILMEEYHEELEEDEDNEPEIFERTSFSASSELRRCVERVVAGRSPTNMIGVFGINSDVVMSNVCRNLTEIRDNLIFVGKIEHSSQVSDVYNNIAAMFFNYLKTSYNMQYDMDYYVREAMLELEKVYDNPQQDYYEYASPLESLSNMSRRYERDRNLLSAINRIKQIINSSSYSRNREPKFVIAVEMETIDYKALNYLSKLNSSDIVIIVFSMFDFDLVRATLRTSFGRGDYMDKFFYPGNVVIAKANAT